MGRRPQRTAGAANGRLVLKSKTLVYMELVPEAVTSWTLPFSTIICSDVPSYSRNDLMEILVVENRIAVKLEYIEKESVMVAWSLLGSHERAARLG